MSPKAPNEWCRPDKYVNRYQGREYDGQALEVITMAFQDLLYRDPAAPGRPSASRRQLLQTLAEDQDMMALVLGALFHLQAQ